MTTVDDGLTHVLGDTWDGVILMAHGGAQLGRRTHRRVPQRRRRESLTSIKNDDAVPAIHLSLGHPLPTGVSIGLIV
jgi:hypothetical protein